MSYSCSVAKQKAQSRSKALRVPFIYAKVRPRQLPTSVRDAVFQSCVFQLSALLEDFISELTSYWFARLLANHSLGSSLPPRLRSIAVVRMHHEAIRKFVGDKDEGKLGEAFLTSSDAFLLLQDNAPLPSIDFHKILVKDKKFPTVSNIESLFRRLGLSKIDQRISKRTSRNFNLALQSFMDVRNALAHENPPSVTDVDVDTYFKRIGSWVDAIDREFYSFVVKTSGAACW